MLSRFIAILMLSPALTVSAHAGGSIETPVTPAHVRSIDYVGYDGTDAAGNPICKICEAEKATEAAKLNAMEERRKRARAYMARMQGQEPATAVAARANVDAMPVGALTDEVLGDVKLRVGLE